VERDEPSLRLAPGSALAAANGVTVAVRGLRKSCGAHLDADDVSLEDRSRRSHPSWALLVFVPADAGALAAF
jgi:hypothetical protein